MRALAFVASLALAACSHSSSSPPPATTSGDPATAVGATPPAITLTSTTNTPVALADVVHANAKTIVVFYRGFF